MRSTFWHNVESQVIDSIMSGHDTVLCLQCNRFQAVKWQQWKLHLFEQGRDDVDLDAVQYAAPPQPGVGPP